MADQVEQSLIAGDPGDLDRLAAELQALADAGLTPLRHRLEQARERSERAWLGASGDALRTRLDSDLAVIDTSHYVFTGCAAVIRETAAALRQAQLQAAVAEVVQLEAVKAASNRYTAGNAMQLHLAAQTMAERAEAFWHAQAQRAAEIITELTAMLPAEPGFFDDIGHHLRQFGSGLRDLATGLFTAAASTSLLRLALDPSGYLADALEDLAALTHAFSSPTRALRTLLDLDTLDESPARWVGHVAPSLLGARALFKPSPRIPGALATAESTVAAESTIAAESTVAAKGAAVVENATPASPALAKLPVAGYPDVPLEERVLRFNGREIGYDFAPPEGSTPTHRNPAYRVRLHELAADGTEQYAWLKPSDASHPNVRARQSVAAYEIDQALQLNVTPATRLVETQWGEASLQQEVVAGDRSPRPHFSPLPRQGAGMVDFITGQRDRHDFNAGWTWHQETDTSGRVNPHPNAPAADSGQIWRAEPALIDNDNAFPKASKHPLNSVFLKEVWYDQLQPQHLENLLKVDRQALTQTLQDLQLSHKQINGVFTRMDTLAEQWMVTKEGWSGGVLNGGKHPLPLPQDIPGQAPYSTWLGADRTPSPPNTWLLTPPPD